MNDTKIRYIALGSLAKALGCQSAGYEEKAMVCDMCKAAYLDDMLVLKHNILCPSCQMGTLRFVTKEEYDSLVKEN